MSRYKNNSKIENIFDTNQENMYTKNTGNYKNPQMNMNRNQINLRKSNEPMFAKESDNSGNVDSQNNTRS